MNLLQPILGSETAEQALIFIFARDQGYAREIARFFGTDLRGIQNQLEKFEYGGVLASKTMGRTRVFVFNPRYAFLQELKSLLEKALFYYPQEMQDKLVMNRRKPRRTGKPI